MVSQTPSQATHVPSALSDSGLSKLQLRANDIATEVTKGYFELHPECYQKDTEKIAAMCSSDFQHHLRFLLSAMVTATPEIFSDYAHWLKNVLESRNLSLQHPLDSFRLMRELIIEHLSERDVPIAKCVLDSGIEALNSDTPDPFTNIIQIDSYSDIAKNFTQALISGDRSNAQTLSMQTLQQGTSLIGLEVDVIQPAMYEIGKLWQENKITVAQEHLATAIAQNTLARCYAEADFDDPIDRKVVCSCIEGNHHSLGLRMISDAYEVSGWDVSFLGADTPNSAILSQVDMDKPDALAISLSLPHQVLSLQKLIQQLRSHL